MLFGVIISQNIFKFQISNRIPYIFNVYMGARSYDDELTIICPIIRGLIKMLKICNKFAQLNKLIFIGKKYICKNLAKTR